MIYNIIILMYNTMLYNLTLDYRHIYYLYSSYIIYTYYIS